MNRSGALVHFSLSRLSPKAQQSYSRLQSEHCRLRPICKLAAVCEETFICRSWKFMSMIVTKENIAFEPALPSWKHAALKRLGMGNVAKVPLGT